MKIIIFVILAACSNAIMDTIKHHWSKSIFSFTKRGTKFREWLWKYFHQLSWQLAYVWMERATGLPVNESLFPYSGKYKIFGPKIWFTILGIKIKKPPQLIDGWHFFKSLMIMLVLLPYALWDQVIVIYDWNQWLLDWFTLGMAWNISFNFFYNKVLIKKKYR